MYLTCYRDQFLAAFDVFLMILCEVKRSVNAALGRDTPDYCLHHTCLTCNYNLCGEPKLFLTRLIAMDGNNSAKRLLSAGKANDWEFQSDYFLSREEVNVFKVEVKPYQKSSEELVEEEVKNVPWIVHGKPEDQFEDNGRPVPCAETWKASATKHHRNVKAIYDSTGIFPAACQHGFIIKICEMVQSGKL